MSPGRRFSFSSCPIPPGYCVRSPSNDAVQEAAKELYTRLLPKGQRHLPSTYLGRYVAEVAPGATEREVRRIVGNLVRRLQVSRCWGSPGLFIALGCARLAADNSADRLVPRTPSAERGALTRAFLFSGL